MLCFFAHDELPDVKMVMRIMNLYSLIMTVQARNKKEVLVPWYSNFPLEAAPGEVPMMAAPTWDYPTASEQKAHVCL